MVDPRVLFCFVFFIHPKSCLFFLSSNHSGLLTQGIFFLSAINFSDISHSPQMTFILKSKGQKKVTENSKARPELGVKFFMG